jgi:hypothetical protein
MGLEKMDENEYDNVIRSKWTSSTSGEETGSFFSTNLEKG